MLNSPAPVSGKLYAEPYSMVSSSRAYGGSAVITWERRDRLKAILNFEGKYGPAIEAKVTFVSDDTLQAYDLVQETQNHFRSQAHGFSFTMSALAYRDDTAYQDHMVDAVNFQLINFPNYFWLTGPISHSHDPIVIHIEDWVIEIETPLLNGDSRNEGERKRGYLITNNGSISCKSGSFLPKSG